MLNSLLTQFRQRYPQGNLISELLTIHDGLFVVRVCAGADGITLACGLGANSTPELAEDLATTRALDRLGLVIPDLTVATALPASGVQRPPETLRPPAPPGVDPGPTTSSLPQPASLAETAQLEPDLEAAANLQTLPPLAPDPLAPNPLASEPPAVVLAIPPDPKTPITSAAAPEDRADDFLHLGVGPVAPVDLSDIIAQTDVELQRLGWDVNQGREFLEKTYGKRSRHDLTDDELLEFLLYLETQSPPDSA